MNKTLDYYMSLPYEIKVMELPEDDGGGVFLSIPLLGEASVNAHGNTYAKARAHLEEVKRDILQILLEAHVDIPEPKTDSEKEFSGKILLRMSKFLHAGLSAMAEEEGVSINTLITNLLNFALGGKAALTEAANVLKGAEVTHVHQHFVAKIPLEDTEKMKETVAEFQNDSYEGACA
ncbi:hypothetical protein AGMMS49957_01740 [Synergistales bacterium]|nr:hypothetical protein AGMMS49957_01740 [Synergistales bacterium]